MGPPQAEPIGGFVRRNPLLVSMQLAGGGRTGILRGRRKERPAPPPKLLSVADGIEIVTFYTGL